MTKHFVTLVVVTQNHATLTQVSLGRFDAGFTVCIIQQGVVFKRKEGRGHGNKLHQGCKWLNGNTPRYPPIFDAAFQDGKQTR